MISQKLPYRQILSTGHAGCSENRRQAAKRDRKRQTPKGGRRLAPHSPLLKKSLCGGGVPSSHPSLGLSVFFLSGGLFSCNHREIHTLTQTSEGKKRGGNIVRPREWNGHHLPRRSRSREVDEKVSGSISMDLPAFSRNPRPLPLPLPLPPSIVGAGSLGGGEGLA